MFHSHNIECSEFRPLQDWLILAPEKVDGEMQAGIFVPANPQAFGKCAVLAAGPDCSLTVKDTVWMQKFVEGELKFRLNGVPVYSIRERRVNVALKGKGLKPVGDRVLVKRIDTFKEKQGFLWVPKAAAETSQECDVVETGGKTKGSVSAGDRILIGKYSGTEVKRDKLTLTIINENDIVGVLKK